MKKKYTIIFIPPAPSNTHQFQFSKQSRRVLGSGILLISVMIFGLFAHNLYLSHYIKERQPTIDHIDQLKSALVERDQEINHLNGMSNQITNDLKSIKDLEEKLTSILKINPTSAPPNISRGVDATAQSYLASNPNIQTLDYQAPMVSNHLNLLQRYYEVALLQKDRLDHTPTILPAEGEITSYHGYRQNPFGGRSTEPHNGIDIGCDYGSPVLATADGVVTYVGRDPIFGLRVNLDHGHGIVTFYGHNSRLLVKVGDSVKKTDLIAHSGNSGRSTGSHLHYGTVVNGENIDPLTFTSFTKEEEPDV